MSYKITGPKRQLEKLVSCQAAWESFLHELTGLTVKVSLAVHSPDNSVTDLLHLFEASLSLPDFKQVSVSNRTWIAHEDLARNISIFMPEGFDADELYPEPEDDEGYNQAVETADYQRLEGQLTRNDDEIPFQGE